MFGSVCSGPLVVFGPRQASCICLHVLRNSPGVHGVPAPQKKRHYYVITRLRYAAMLHCLCLGEESRMQQMSGRHLFVYIVAQQKSQLAASTCTCTSMVNRAHLKPLLLCLLMHIVLLWRAQPVCVCCVMMLMIIWRGRGLAAPRALILKSMLPCLQSDSTLVCVLGSHDCPRSLIGS